MFKLLLIKRRIVESKNIWTLNNNNSNNINSSSNKSNEEETVIDSSKSDPTLKTHHNEINLFCEEERDQPVLIPFPQIWRASFFRGPDWALEQKLIIWIVSL